MRPLRKVVGCAAVLVILMTGAQQLSAGTALTICDYVGAAKDSWGKPIDVYYCVTRWEDGTWTEYWTTAPRERQPTSPV